MHRLPRCLLALGCSVLMLNPVVGGDDAKTAALPKTPAKIDRLIKQLGSDKFEEREAASKALEAIGEPARDALRKAESGSDDPEVRRRAERAINALDANLTKQSLSLKEHTGMVESVAFRPDGKRIASADRDRTVKVWDADNGLKILSLKGHDNAI